MECEGYSGAFFDGRFVYFTPIVNSEGLSGNFLRYDTQGDFAASSSWSARDVSGTDGLNTRGYTAGAFDGRYLYFSPSTDAVATAHGNVLRYDTIGNQGSFQLTYSALGHQGGFGGSLPGSQFLVNTSEGAFSVAQHGNVTAGWHLIAGTFDGAYVKLYVDGSLAAERSARGTLVSNSTDFLIGAVNGKGGTFSGLIDEVQVFDRAVDASEVQSIFAADSRGVCK